jgi:predicted ribosome quality control (RQC) complex YloA/Tae2 family protein
MTKLAELQAALTSKREDLEQMQDTLASMEADPLAHFEDEVTSAWDNFLNEMYGEQVDALPWYCGSAARLCEDKDNTFYRCGLNDYADGFDVTGLDAYTDLEGEIEDLESEIESLEEEIEELEEEEEEDEE